MEDIIKNLTGIGLLANLIGMMFLVYKHFRNPDISASKRLSIIETTCPIKHKTLDDAISTFARNLELIKENHLRHIEGDISKINEKMARMEGKSDTMIELMKDVLNKK